MISEAQIREQFERDTPNGHGFKRAGEGYANWFDNRAWDDYKRGYQAALLVERPLLVQGDVHFSHFSHGAKPSRIPR